jgi:hypothetical protein
MRQQTRPLKEPAEKVVQDIRRATRKHYSAEEKIRIVLEGLRGEDSIAELCRRMFVKLRFAASPIMAFLIWQRGDYWIAVLALLWPFAGVMIVLWMVGLLRAPLSLTALGRAGEIGPVQRRFLAALGYEYLGQPRTKSLNDG